ncbi:hypothetical protein PTRA_a2311 [Pseudoalteromonas translucida KMM 520]|uniref:Uncharacterized protein n=1 Tax=Pseudoalteromonas translucida KMM 520 TaxID=1315283 RepID=A0A0U2X0J6_9GAMM|nr:hypothetical protein PTRA_a2311 [Pseudoalteromonas translucida KMM 520]
MLSRVLCGWYAYLNLAIIHDGLSQSRLLCLRYIAGVNQ